MPQALPLLHERDMVRPDGRYDWTVIRQIAHRRARVDMARIAKDRREGRWTFGGLPLPVPSFVQVYKSSLRTTMTSARVSRALRLRSIAVAAMSPVKKQIWSLALEAEIAERAIPPDHAKADRVRALADALSRDEAARVALANFADRIVTFETEGPTDQRFAAHYVGDEEKPVGAFGPTREAAARDLIDNYDLPHAEAAE